MGAHDSKRSSVSFVCCCFSGIKLLEVEGPFLGLQDSFWILSFVLLIIKKPLFIVKGSTFQGFFPEFAFKEDKNG